MGIIPLLQPFHDTDLASGKYSEAILRQYLQPQWLCRGVGEIVLSKPELQSVTFDGSVMQTVFKVVNDMKGIVMVHPSSVFQGGGARTTDLAEIEPSIKKYPDTIFLFHPLNNFDLIAPLMSKYPNVYYSWDFAGSFYRGASYRTSLPLAQLSTWGSAMFPTDPNAANAESFLAMVNQVGVDHIVEENLKMLAPQLQKYPDRIMWGTDLAHPWHFEESVTDMVIRISHELIGRLPADVQEKYAYQNAQRVFGRFLPSNP